LHTRADDHVVDGPGVDDSLPVAEDRRLQRGALLYLIAAVDDLLQSVLPVLTLRHRQEPHAPDVDAKNRDVGQVVGDAHDQPVATKGDDDVRPCTAPEFILVQHLAPALLQPRDHLGGQGFGLRLTVRGDQADPGHASPLSHESVTPRDPRLGPHCPWYRINPARFTAASGSVPRYTWCGNWR